MKYLVLMLLLTMAVLPTYSQGLGLYGGGANQASTGGMLNTPYGIEAIYGNAASIPDDAQHWGVDFSLNRKFNLDELTIYGAGIYYRIGKSVFALAIVRYGFEAYTEQRLQVTYSRKLFHKLNISGNLNLIQYRLGAFGNPIVATMDLGAIMKINRVFSVATFVSNPATITGYREIQPPALIAIGTNYHPSSKVQWLVEIEKIIDRSLTLKSAIVYYPSEQINIRFGADIIRGYVGFGVGYRLSGISITGAYSVNQILGNYPGLSLSYEQ